MDILTKEKLEAMKPHHVFEFRAGRDGGRTFMFVAKKGGIDDWAIYTTLNAIPFVDFWVNEEKEIAKYGKKVVDRELIKKLVPCDEGVLQIYRY